MLTAVKNERLYQLDTSQKTTIFWPARSPDFTSSNFSFPIAHGNGYLPKTFIGEEYLTYSEFMK